MRKRRKKNKNKWVKWLSLTVLLTATMAAILLFDGKVFSTDGNVERKIIFNDKSWDMSGNKATPGWFTANGDKVSFQVDLQGDYENLKDDAENLDELEEIPFLVGSKFDNNTIEDGFTVEKVDEANFNGLFNVTIPLLTDEDDGTLTVTIDFPDDNGWGITEGTKTFTIVKDTVAPKIRYSGVPESDNKATDKSVSLNLAVTEKNLVMENNLVDSEIHLSVTRNGKSFESADFPVWKKTRNTVKWDYEFTKDGYYEITVKTIDAAGNSSAETIDFTIDQNPPELKLSPTINNGEILPATDFSFEISNGIEITDVNVYATKDGEDYQLPIVDENGKGEIFKFTHSFTEDGEYEITISVNDDGYKKYHEFDPKSFTIDNTPPKVEINGLNGEINYYKVNPKVEVTISDEHLDMESSSIRVKKNGVEIDTPNLVKDNEKTATAKFDDVFNSNGKYELIVEGYDSLQRSTKEKRTIVIDKTSPKIEVINRVDGEAISDGEHYKNSEEAVIKIKETNLNLNQTSINVTKDGLEVPFNKNLLKDKGNHTYEYSVDITDSGNYRLAINPVDLAGNEDFLELAFTVDKTAPEIKIEGVEMSDGEEVYLTEPTDVTMSVKESNYQDTKVDIKVTKDNESYNIGNWKYDSPDFQYKHEFNKDGQYSITVTATDKAGNRTEKSTSFILDQKSPEISLVDENQADLQKTYYNENKTATVIIDDNNIKRNDIEISVTTFGDDDQSNEDDEIVIIDWKKIKSAGKKYRYSQEFADGHYEISIVAKDKAGNNSAKKTVEFWVDTEAPALEVTGVDKNQFYNKLKTVHVKVADENLDLAHTSLSVTKNEEILYNEASLVLSESGKHAQFTFEIEPSAEGVYEISLSSTDKANNTKTLNDFAFTMDSTLPEIIIVGAENSSEEKQVEITITDKNLDFGAIDINVTKNGEPFHVMGQLMGLENTLLSKKENEAKFTIHFEENGKYKVVVRAADYASNSLKTEREFIVDKDEPEVSIIKAEEQAEIEDGKHYQTGSTAKITIEDFTFVNENTTVEMWKNQEPVAFDERKFKQTDTTGEYVVDLTEEAEYRIRVKSVDLVGNETIVDQTFVIDKTNPKLTISGVDKDFSNDDIPVYIRIEELNYEQNKVDIKVTKDDKEYDLGDVSPNSDVISEINHTFVAEGAYKISIDSTDPSGRSAHAEAAFTIDKVKPEIKIVDEKNAALKDEFYYDSEKKATVKISDLHLDKNDITISVTGHKTFTVKPDEITLKDGVASFSKDFEDGAYTITVDAIDKAENEATQKAVSFTVDTVAPKLTVDGVNDGDHYKNKQTVNVNVFDTNLNLDSTDFIVTKDSKQLYSSADLVVTGPNADFSFEINSKDEGKYKISLRSTDKAGNTKEIKDISFVIDSTTPVLTITGVNNGSFNNTTKNATFSIKELNYLSNFVDFKVTKDGQDYTDNVEKDGKSWRNASIVSKLTHSFNGDGYYTIEVKSFDKANNGKNADGNLVNAKSLAFTIDKTKPSIEINGVDEDTHYNVDKNVSISIKDVNLNVNKITVTKDGRHYPVGNFTISAAKYADSTASLQHRFTQEGDYKILVEATDKAGNSHSKAVKFTIDKTKPVITPKFKGENRVIKDGEYINKMFTPEFVLDEKEDQIVSVTLNDGPNVRGNVPIASKEMEYNYKVVATDKAGNVQTLVIGFILDTTKPELEITGVLDGFYNKNLSPKVTYSDKHLDKEKTSVTLNGKAFASGTKLDYERDYVLKAVITDLANNVSTRTIVFTIDKTAPKIKFKEPISEQYFNEDLIPELIISDFSDYDIIAQTLDGEVYNVGDPIEGEGKHVLYFEVKDKAGNISQISVEFIIDKTPPKVIYEGVREGDIYLNPVNISIKLDNPLDTIKEVLINGHVFDGEVVEEDGYKVIKTTLSDVDQYEIQVFAEDEAGNIVEEVIPFKIAEKGILAKFYENKPLFTGSIAGVIIVTVIGLGTLVFRRRKVTE